MRGKLKILYLLYAIYRAFGGSGIIRGVAFGGSGIIRGVAFGGSDLIKEGLVYQMIPIQICFILFYYFFLVCIYFNLFFISLEKHLKFIIS
jgi:hypothetical protein